MIAFRCCASELFCGCFLSVTPAVVGCCIAEVNPTKLHEGPRLSFLLFPSIVDSPHLYYHIKLYCFVLWCSLFVFCENRDKLFFCVRAYCADALPAIFLKKEVFSHD